jgi:hypothetical protein
MIELQQYTVYLSMLTLPYDVTQVICSNEINMQNHRSETNTSTIYSEWPKYCNKHGRRQRS